VPYVLLTTVCRPFGGNGEGHSVGAELFHAQVTRSQGIFSYRQVIRCWGLDYIAENIEAPTVVLHYPSKREFRHEIQKQRYDIIGINFVVATFHKVQQMADMEPFCPMMSFALIAILSVGKKASVLCAGF
jgi:hypothetical protein